MLPDRSADDDDVAVFGDDVFPSRRRQAETEFALDPVQELGVPPIDDGELEDITPSFQVGEMGADRPRAGTDHSQTKLGHVVALLSAVS